MLNGVASQAERPRRFDYSRRGRQMSLRMVKSLLIKRVSAAPANQGGAPLLLVAAAPGGLPMLLAAVALIAALPCSAQYVGKVAKDSKEAPELRSIAVLEWTGDEGQPKASRLIPVAVLDGGELQDGGIYLARPEPMALIPEVEYELEQNGQPLGLFDISTAGQQQGSWVGLGKWKPMPSAKPRPPAAKVHLADDDDTQSDEPVLHRKHHADDAPSVSPGASSSSGDTTSQNAPSDPDRPVLHKKTSSDSTDSSSSQSAGNSGAATPSPNLDPDQPTLHRKTDSSDSSASDSASASAPSDPDRPVLKKARKKPPADTADVESVAGDTDPDRPRLKRGKSSGDAIEVTPTLMGFPPDVQQTVAVSDARAIPVHPWSYAWTNPDDEAKMKATLEDLARSALGLTLPPAPAKPAAKSAAGSATRPATRRTPAKKAATPPPPAPLEGEQFRVFELAYGSGATLVLSAHTGGPAAQQKFVTLIAQPDLYGNALVLLKNVTDGAHLDEKPRMRLVDAVDAMADNRGELLFELRGATQRQFALYRVLRGQAEKLFVSGGGDVGPASSE